MNQSISQKPFIHPLIPQSGIGGSINDQWSINGGSIPHPHSHLGQFRVTRSLPCIFFESFKQTGDGHTETENTQDSDPSLRSLWKRGAVMRRSSDTQRPPVVRSRYTQHSGIL